MIKRVLVVEDQEDNRVIIHKTLTSAGYEVIEALNGRQGVALAESEIPDIILMDIQLPEIDGYEATRRIKANASLRKIPVIAVTSYALSGDDVKAREAGCDAYLSKPFSPRKLRAKLVEILGVLVGLARYAEWSIGLATDVASDLDALERPRQDLPLRISVPHVDLKDIQVIIGIQIQAKVEHPFVLPS